PLSAGNRDGLAGQGTAPAMAAGGLAARPQASFWGLIWRQLSRNHAALAGAGILLAFALLAVGAPAVAPYEPNAVDFLARLRPPGESHLLGTDQFGRDLLSR